MDKGKKGKREERGKHWLRIKKELKEKTSRRYRMNETEWEEKDQLV